MRYNDNAHTPSANDLPSIEDAPTWEQDSQSRGRTLTSGAPTSYEHDAYGSTDAYADPYADPYADSTAYEAPTERLGRDEVAAVHASHKLYINDVPSPYLTERQAQEDIETTRHRHTVLSTTFVIVLLTAILAGAGWFVWDTLRPEKTPEIPAYNTAPIERMEFVNSIDTTAVVRPIDERSVASEVSGTVTSVVAVEGAFANEGDVLYTLENPTVTETYQKAQEALDAAQSTVDKKQAAYDKALKAFREEQAENDSPSSSSSGSGTSSNGGSSSNSGSGNRGRSTTSDQSTTDIARGNARPTFFLATATTEDDTTLGFDTTTDDPYATDDDSTDDDTDSTYDDSDATSTSTDSSSLVARTPTEAALLKVVQTTQKELDKAKDDLEPIQEMYDRAEAQFNRLTVRAPISGTVSDLSTSIGVSSQIIGSERLCTVSDLSAYVVQQEVQGERMGQVHEGEEARLSFPAIGDLFITSIVSSVSDNEEGNGRIASVIIENPDDRITKNMACNVSIVIQSIPNALVVPVEAIHTNAEGATELNILLDPTRGINTYVHVNVLGTNATQAAVEADNIQAGTSVILPTPKVESEAESGSEAEPATADAA